MTSLEVLLRQKKEGVLCDSDSNHAGMFTTVSLPTLCLVAVLASGEWLGQIA